MVAGFLTAKQQWHPTYLLQNSRGGPLSSVGTLLPSAQDLKTLMVVPSVTVPRTPRQLHPAKTPSSLPTISYCFAKCAEPRRVHQHAPTPRHGPGFVLIRPHYEFIMNLFVVQTLHWIHGLQGARLSEAMSVCM